jgi:hypothetical protein
MLLSGLMAPHGASAQATPFTSPSEILQEEVQLIHLVNLERRVRNLPPLRWNRELSDAARWFAQDVVANQPAGFCGHTDSLGRRSWDRIRDFGYSHMGASGENAICGYATPEASVEMWLNSPSHRAIMLDPTLREIGAGYAHTLDGRGYVVIDLAIDGAYAPVVIDDEAPGTQSSQVNLYIYDYSPPENALTAGPPIEMLIANDPQFAGATWEPFRHEKAWQLEEGTGWRTVYVKTRDKWGRTNIVSDTIYLGGSPPPTELTLVHASQVEAGFRLAEVDAGNWPQLQFSLEWLFDDTDESLRVLEGAGWPVSDPAAVGGTAMRLPGGTQPARVWGWAAVPFHESSMLVYFRFKISSQAPEDQVRVTVSCGESPLAVRTLKGTDFAGTDLYQEFAVPIAIGAGDQNLLVVDITRLGTAEVTWDGATLYTAAQPAAAPLVYTTPDGYYRSGGVKARLSNPDGDFTAPLRVDAHVARFLRAGSVEGPNAPTLTVSQHEISFGGAGGAALGADLTVICTGCVDHAWEAVSSAPWLTVRRAGNTLTLQANPGSLETGLHTAEVVITPAAANGIAPQRVAATLIAGNLREVFPHELFLPALSR